ncbi:MAG: winged helix-turn-helix domain-containing protein [Kiritimatiellae bacterium]|nr:winged helix-turn-helix domain-containing protein [Kiritimatiellia bacterium]
MLRPPVFDIDARHFTVTVYRPVFDEKGNRVSSEVGPNSTEVKAKTEEVKVKPNFEIIMKDYRRDLRETCARIWECLASNAELTQREIATRLQISESSVLSAMNALQEVGLLRREGYGKGRHWIVENSVP